PVLLICPLPRGADDRRCTGAPTPAGDPSHRLTTVPELSMMARSPSAVLHPLLCVPVAALLCLAGDALAQKSPEETVKSFKVARGLEATLWATEPGMVNPTNMDIDERGRIWVTEAANYRGSKLRPEG